MIRDALIGEIYEHLMANHSFRIEDFSVFRGNRPDQATSDSIYVISIQYVYNPRYYFSMEFHQDVDVVFASYRPGYARMEESSDYEFKELKTCFSQIFAWTNRIESELAAAPLLRKMEEQRRRVSKIEEVIEGIPDEYLTREEACELISRLERLERQIIENISQDQDDDLLLAEELKAARADIERLKSQVEQLTKKSWVRSFLARSMDWAEAHPKTIGIALSTVNHLVSSNALSTIDSSSASHVLIESGDINI